MVTQEEIRILNRDVDIPLLLSFLGASPENIKQMGRKADWRVNAWFRGGDNTHGVGVMFDYQKEKWFVTDFTGRTFSHLDLIDFMTKILKKSFFEAVDLLIFASGKENGHNASVTLEKPRILTEPEPLDQSIMNTFESGLHPFWHARGYSPEIANFYKLGWCNIGEMADRLTIPIVDERNRLVAIQGRSTKENDVPKYKFLTGTGESAKLCLYEYKRAWNEAQQRGWVGIVESANAVWRAKQYGYNNFVATLSTSVTERQIKLLTHMNVNPVIFFDYDATETMSGQVAAIKLGNALLERINRPIYICNIGFHAGPADLTQEQFFMTMKNAFIYKG